MACVVAGCRSHTSRRETRSTQDFLTFHRFPKDDVKKNEWLKQIGRQNWSPRKHSHICSKHFTIDSFICGENVKWRRLTEVAVPTLLVKNETDEKEVYEEKHSAVLQSQETDQQKWHSKIYATGRQEPIPVAIIKTVPSSLVHSAQPLTSCVTISHQSQKSLIQMTSRANLNIEMNYLTRIHKLERELERCKMICKRRFRKIKTLTKRLSRLANKKNEVGGSQTTTASVYLREFHDFQ